MPLVQTSLGDFAELRRAIAPPESGLSVPVECSQAELCGNPIGKGSVELGQRFHALLIGERAADSQTLEVEDQGFVRGTVIRRSQ